MSQDAGKEYWAETDTRRKRGCLRVLVVCLVLAVALTLLVSL